MAWRKKAQLPELPEDEEEDDPESEEEIEDEMMEELHTAKKRPQVPPLPKYMTSTPKQKAQTSQKWEIVENPVQVEIRFKNNETGELLNTTQAILRILQILDTES